MSIQPRNERSAGVTKFCRAMEEHRRTDAGRVKSPKEFVDHFFAWGPSSATDRLFVHIPQAVRGPVLSGWQIRGAKTALKDDDAKVKSVVHDALLAGDIDENVFERGVGPDMLVDWIPLDEWWAFWRSGRITGVPVQRALATARELGLFDDAWFLANLKGRGGRLSGTDVVCDTLSKDQIVAWIRNVHQSGDGSPAGLVAALGWDVILSKTAQDALLHVLDAFAKKVGLVKEAAKAEPPKEEAAKAEPLPMEHSDSIEISIPDFPVEERDSRTPPAPATEPPKGESGWPESLGAPDPAVLASQPPGASSPPLPPKRG
jgi:hypothetical protein